MSLAPPLARHDMHTHIWHAPGHPDRVPEGLDGSVDALLADLDAAGVTRAAVITPRSMGWDDGVTLAAAAAHPDRLVAVVRCDLDAPDVLATLRASVEAGARGIRIAVDDGPLDRLLADDLAPLRAYLQDTRLPLALHGHPQDLPAVVRILESLPGHPVLLDHFGRPVVAEGIAEPGFQRVLALAEHPGLHLKTPDVPFFTVGGKLDDIVPFISAAVDAFGPSRIAWGSDWPLCTAGHGYAEIAEPIATALAALSPAEQALVWHGTFDRLYG